MELLRLVDNEGLAAAHVAARYKRARMLTAIREYAADAMAVRDRQGRTAMHHAAVTLSREDFEQVFGDFVRPHEGNKANVPDADGWTPLHWACKGSDPGVVELLLAGYKHPIRALGYPCARGWTAMDVAVFHRKDDILEFVEKYAIAMDPEWGGPCAPWPPVSVEEAFQGRDDGRSAADIIGQARTQPSPAPVGWEAGVRSGLRSDSKRVVPGVVHPYVRCDDCQCMVSANARTGPCQRPKEASVLTALDPRFYLPSPSTASASSAATTPTSTSASSATGTATKRTTRRATPSN
jgi:hypothetical protein